MILAITLLAFAAQPPQPQTPNPCDSIKPNVWDPKFTPGQKWAYYSRPNDVGSTVTIAEIDDVPTIGFVVYVLVDNLGTLRVDQINGKTVKRLMPGGTEHFAIERDSLASSVTDLIDNVRIPILDYHYSNYRAHCIAQTYATTVADTLTMLDLLRCEQAARHTPLPLRPCQTTPSQSTASPSRPAPSPPTSAPPSPAPSANSPPSPPQPPPSP
jgi:hypothetical protein